MDLEDWPTERFEENRSHLRAVAYRMLGSLDEADDAVQEAWLRLSRADTSRVDNLRGWLTTVVARVCLDMLRSRKSRREEPLGAELPEPVPGPEHEVMLADSVGLALLVVLETLSPAERVAFVLHDLFELPFEDIAPIVGRSEEAARQLASRARRRVRGTEPPPSPDRARHRALVDAFLAAARAGEWEGDMPGGDRSSRTWPNAGRHDATRNPACRPKRPGRNLSSHRDSSAPSSAIAGFTCADQAPRGRAARTRLTSPRSCFSGF